MTEEDDIVPVYVARNVTEADVIRGLLEANDIEAVIEDEEGTVMLDAIITGNRGITVSVVARDLEEARRAIQEAHDYGQLRASEEE